MTKKVIRSSEDGRTPIPSSPPSLTHYLACEPGGILKAECFAVSTSMECNWTP